MNKYMAAYVAHRAEAEQALAIFRGYCALPLPRVPGMDTVIRLAWRIECGHDVLTAAAREYVYRWQLAVKPADQAVGDFNCIDPPVSCFGTPDTIGM